MDNCIYVSGARENNLKNISVKIPRETHTAIIGVSGSGKSSLAYDVIYAAGQKRLLDCLSETSKHFTSRLKQPDVNFIEGLTPVISVKQYKPPMNPRSTVGTLSELSTYMRYLYSATGEALCPYCKKSYPVLTLQYLANELTRFPEGTEIEIQFIVYKNRIKKYEDFFGEFRKKGFRQIIINGERKDFRDWIEVEDLSATMSVVAGKIQTKKELSHSDIGLLKTALQNGNGFTKIEMLNTNARNECKWFFEKHGCAEHNIITAEIMPDFFSFNNPASACEECGGSGFTKRVAPESLVKNKRKSLRQKPFFSSWAIDMNKPHDYCKIYSIAIHYGFSFDEPFENLPQYAKDILFYGTNEETFLYQLPEGYSKNMPNFFDKQVIGTKITFEGLASRIDKLYEDTKNCELGSWMEYHFENYMVNEICISCNGTRLKPQRQLITINGLCFDEISNMELSELLAFVTDFQILPGKAEIITPIANEICSKLNALCDTGLGYLSLNRRTDTLSSGEYQRVRLAGQIGSGLTGLTYIIDEPTIGLHSADNRRIINLIERIRSKGNTVITIEHDIDIIKSADHIIEIGPGSGEHGGEIIAQGTLDEIANNERSIIAPFLVNEKNIEAVKSIHNARTCLNESNDCIKIVGAMENNLKNISVEIPLNRLICLTGVSGSGKSSLAIEILYKAFWANLHNAKIIPGKHERIEGMEKISDIYCIDQSTMGLSKISIPATYIGFFDAVRKVFSESSDAAEKGLDHISHYSFNSAGGCTSCKGAGTLDTHIQYLGDLNVICPLCEGARYKDEVLAVKYKGKNISEVLKLTIETALTFFSDQQYIYNKLKCVDELGLGYMTLGQSISTISGGEAQRLRLAKELSKIRRQKNMLYILDEPTTGLHAKDIKTLLLFLQKIVANGNTVLLIEHNPDVILNADYIIDIGPGAGKNGGTVVVAGGVSDIVKCNDSVTGQYLKKYSTV